jgi:hypothetical protein
VVASAVITLVYKVLSDLTGREWEGGRGGGGRNKQNKKKKNRATNHHDSTIAETWPTDLRKIELLNDILDNKRTYF